MTRVFAALEAERGPMTLKLETIDPSQNARGWLNKSTSGQMGPQNADLVLWWDCPIDPSQANAFATANIPQFAINMSGTRLEPLTRRIRNRQARVALGKMDKVYCATHRAVDLARRLKVSETALVDSGEIIPTPRAPSCDEARFLALSKSLSGRPMWLLAGVTLDELTLLARAHRQILRRGVRLLMVVVPQKDLSIKQAERLLKEDSWVTETTLGSDKFSERTEVLLVNEMDPLPLWSRLCSVSFVGGSLSPQGALNDPLETALLGSTLIHGPFYGAYTAAFSLLFSARCSCQVATSNDVIETVQKVLAPHHAAELAHRAWDLLTSSAEMTDQLVQDIHNALDQREAL